MAQPILHGIATRNKKNEYRARIKILQCITVLCYVLSTKLRTL